jgi:hypothetical protein
MPKMAAPIAHAEALLGRLFAQLTPAESLGLWVREVGGGGVPPRPKELAGRLAATFAADFGPRRAAAVRAAVPRLIVEVDSTLFQIGGAAALQERIGPDLPPLRRFVGREAELADCAAALDAGLDVCLVGAAGGGLTSLAARVGRDRLEVSTLVWTLRGPSAERIAVDLSRLAHELGLPADPDEVRRWLKEIPGWLLIVLDEPERMPAILGPGLVLSTSRRMGDTAGGRPGARVLSIGAVPTPAQPLGPESDEERALWSLLESLGPAPFDLVCLDQPRLEGLPEALRPLVRSRFAAEGAARGLVKAEVVRREAEGVYLRRSQRNRVVGVAPEVAAAILGRAFEVVDPGDVLRVRGMLPHVHHLKNSLRPEQYAALTGRAGRALTGTGQYLLGAQLLQEGAQFSTPGRDKATLLNDLGVCLRRAGDLLGARAALEAAIGEEAETPADADTAGVWLNLGHVHADSGDLMGAWAAYLASDRLFRVALGPESKDRIPPLLRLWELGIGLGREGELDPGEIEGLLVKPPVSSQVFRARFELCMGRLEHRRGAMGAARVRGERAWGLCGVEGFPPVIKAEIATLLDTLDGAPPLKRGG